MILKSKTLNLIQGMVQDDTSDKYKISLLGFKIYFVESVIPEKGDAD
jgi:hypothetical protein